MPGDPQVRFGGRGHRNQSMLPTPILIPASGGDLTCKPDDNTRSSTSDRTPAGIRDM
jgi:hypothetical protein